MCHFVYLVFDHTHNSAFYFVVSVCWQWTILEDQLAVFDHLIECIESPKKYTFLYTKKKISKLIYVQTTEKVKNTDARTGHIQKPNQQNISEMSQPFSASAV